MKILLAVDDSEFSLQAVRTLVAQIRREGAEVRVMHVVEPAFNYVSADMGVALIPYLPKIEEERRSDAQKLVLRMTQMLRDAGFQAKEIVEEGDPKHKILDSATEWGADLIVLGSHGRTAWGRFLLGSVSEAVARHAKCSVQVVRMKNAGADKPAK
jgi:nucleotide-binding universal stress UspA family protein